jgi:hypothetical protein
MSALKITLAAASLALVAATTANAQTYVPASKRQVAIEASQTRAQYFGRGYYQHPANQWELNSPQPFSRDASENFTW